MASKRAGAFLRLAAPLAIMLAVLAAYYLVWHRGGEALTVYCAHDSVYAEQVLRGFERSTGIPVDPKYDTEATKSLGLVELIKRERNAPRCDVFWNNQLLGTLDLQEQGLLLPYKGSGYERIPAAFKDPEGRWTGFGARLRVYIVNTDKMEARDEAVAQALAGDLSSVAIAKPLYGTTLSHYSVLWNLWGEDRLKAWHADWRGRGVVEATGNAHVKSLVAEGVCSLGLTDTDDYFVALDEGKPVAALPVRLPGSGATICIPNTVSMIRGTPREADARRLMDYLLSEECELALARSKSRQVPLGPVDEAALPAEVAELKRWAAEGTPLGGLGAARTECLAWLKSEYLK